MGHVKLSLLLFRSDGKLHLQQLHPSAGGTKGHRSFHVFHLLLFLSPLDSYNAVQHWYRSPRLHRQQSPPAHVPTFCFGNCALTTFWETPDPTFAVGSVASSLWTPHHLLWVCVVWGFCWVWPYRCRTLIRNPDCVRWSTSAAFTVVLVAASIGSVVLTYKITVVCVSSNKSLTPSYMEFSLKRSKNIFTSCLRSEKLCHHFNFWGMFLFVCFFSKFLDNSFFSNSFFFFK